MPTPNRTNLHEHLKYFSSNEKVVLLNVIKFKWGWGHYHIGMLPFMNRREVAGWVAAWTGGNANARRIHRQILMKLCVSPASTDFVMLDDVKVRRRFGNHPERGVMIPGLPSMHVKRERKMFERVKDAYDVTHKIVSLRNVGRNRWVVSCEDRVKQQVLSWLQANVGE